MKITFEVPAIPTAQPRQRHAVVGGHLRNYTPTKHPITAYRATVRMAFQATYQGAPLQGPLSCRMVFVMPRPQSMIWKKREMPRVWHTKKPDSSNLIKGTEDSLLGIAYHDDSQICRLEIEKWIAAGDEQPHVEITLEELDDQT